MQRAHQERSSLSFSSEALSNVNDVIWSKQMLLILSVIFPEFIYAIVSPFSSTSRPDNTRKHHTALTLEVILQSIHASLGHLHSGASLWPGCSHKGILFFNSSMVFSFCLRAAATATTTPTNSSAEEKETQQAAAAAQPPVIGIHTLRWNFSATFVMIHARKSPAQIHFRVGF